MATHKSEVIVILHSNDSIFNLSLCWLFGSFSIRGLILMALIVWQIKNHFDQS